MNIPSYETLSRVLADHRNCGKLIDYAVYYYSSKFNISYC